MKEEKRYNHAFDVAFQVPDSKYEDWYDCLKHEKQEVINALQRRIRELFEAKEYLEAISGFDTYDEEIPEADNSGKATKKVTVDNN
jgi:hypothetical protein